MRRIDRDLYLCIAITLLWVVLVLTIFWVCKFAYIENIDFSFFYKNHNFIIPTSTPETIKLK